MQSKLQALTEKIYQEGVQQGEAAAQLIRKEAEEAARLIIEEAQQEADQLRRQAQLEAEQQKDAAHTELRLAADRAQNHCRKRIAELLIHETLGPPLEDAFENTKFLKEMIQTLVKSWAGSEGIELIFPEEGKDSLYNWAARTYRMKLGKGLEVNVNEQLKSNFAIRPQGKGYMIQFDAPAFQAFFAELLRPSTRDLLFGTPSPA